jgi:glycosyltransferase involved in cell wall biosynthesis
MNKGVVWLINPYGNIPGEDWTEYRFSMIARCLSMAGYKVRWFVADFEHRSKSHRVINYMGFEVLPGYSISVIKSSTYKKHVSIDRILFERAYANNLLKSAILINERPDLIIFGEPAIFVADLYKRIVNKFECAYVIDILDLWPEIFISILPQFLRKSEKIILSPFYLIRRRFFKSAIGFTAVVPDYLNIILDKNGTQKKEVVYIGIPEDKETNIIIDDHHLIPAKNANEVWLVYSGTLGHSYDIASIMKLSLQIRDREIRNVKIMIAGDGEMRIKLEEFISLNTGVNLFYLGKLNKRQLIVLYKNSDIAISSYNKYSPVSMPLKAYDYFYHGLPIINSLDRELYRLVSEIEVGIQYESGNFESMWNAFITLYNNKELRIRMGNNSRQLGNSFTFEKQYSKYLNFIEDLFRNRDTLIP